jgi:hypothetical protein
MKNDECLGGVLPNTQDESSSKTTVERKSCTEDEFISELIFLSRDVYIYFDSGRV